MSPPVRIPPSAITWQYRPDSDEHPDRTGAHQVQRRRIRGAPTNDHRQVEPADELLEVERLRTRRDVLRGGDGPLDDQDVETRIHDRLREPLDPLRRE